MTNKLPVVGRRYVWKHADSTILIDKIHDDGEIVYKVGKGYLSSVEGENFWDYFEELPEDKTDLPKPSNQINWEERKKDIEEYFSRKGITVTWEKEKAETKPTIKENLQVGLSPEVKEAIEELKKILIKESDSMFFTVHQSEHTTEVLRLTCHAFSDKAKKLLNALDKQFNLPQENTNLGENGEGFGGDLGKNRVGGLENKESIWKPISELNKSENNDLLLRTKDKKIIFGEYLVGVLYKPNQEYDFITLTDFINDYEKLKERVKKLEEK